tara:strand:+ start:128 stop:553 length:426 start_codon:yes stop_codon:yes gene_type:complete
MKNFLIFLAAASLGGFFMPTHGQEPPPPGIKPMTVPFQIFCADSFSHLAKILRADFAEVPVMMSYLREHDDPPGSQRAITFVLFTNESKTSSTLVISKIDKDRESSCIVWSGSSPSGGALLLSPEPDFPPEPVKQQKGEEM